MSESAALASKLRAEGEKVSQFMANLSEDDWKAEVYAEGTTWSVRSVIAHLMTTERALLKLFDRIRRGGDGVSEDFSIDRYNASQQEKTRDVAQHEFIEIFVAGRERMIEFVAGLTSEDLDRRGRHPFLGMTTLRDMVKMLYIHNQTHLRDVRRALRTES